MSDWKAKDRREPTFYEAEGIIALRRGQQCVGRRRGHLNRDDVPKRT